MAEKTPVVLIQSADNQVRRVRVAGVGFDVMNAAAVPVAGRMCVHLTIADVELSAESAPIAAVAEPEPEAPAAEPAPAAETPAADAA